VTVAGSHDEDSDARSTAVAGKLAASAAASVAATFRLAVIDGADRGMAVLVSASRPSPLLIGQSSSCELRLADRQVSRRHAAVDVVGSRLHLTDLGSTNGTVVNGVSVTSAHLRGGEIVRMGETAVEVALLDAASIVELPIETSYGRMIGKSAEMRRLYPLCDKLAGAGVPVVIEGETGTGKELLAESIHEKGPRAAAPFVVFDCTAVPAALVESELFGHERGAFTGAVAMRKGVFEQAHMGTLLIDEIGDLDLALQPKLLRALERSEVKRVGGDQLIKVDVRVLSATRRDLDREVQAGRFRDDLFHRLAVTRIELPPLRQRRGDVAHLAEVFARQLGSDRPLPEAVLRRWEDYPWPGNVRELRNAVTRYLALGEVDAFDLDALASQGAGARQPGPNDGALEGVLSMGLPYSRARQRVLAEFERRYVERVLAEHGGNVLRAAAASGIARRHLQRVRARNLKEK
jgi:two-component system, NtrC family, response regulator HydG